MNQFNTYKDNIEIYRLKCIENNNKESQNNDKNELDIMNNNSTFDDEGNLKMTLPLCDMQLNTKISLSKDIEQASDSLNTICNIELLEKLHSDLDIIDKELSQFKLDDQNEQNKDEAED